MSHIDPKQDRRHSVSRGILELERRRRRTAERGEERQPAERRAGGGA
jgi:hypothetical protein